MALRIPSYNAKPIDAAAIVTLAAINAQSVTDDLLVDWTHHELAGVRSVARHEIARRQAFSGYWQRRWRTTCS